MIGQALVSVADDLQVEPAESAGMSAGMSVGIVVSRCNCCETGPSGQAAPGSSPTF
jgi:hypothetical protein